ncbi:hypothetical protein ACC848_40530, partial [Rhizobium johnstonii]
PSSPPQIVDTRSVWRQHPIVGTLTYAIGAGIALALIINFWFIVLPLVIVGAGGYVGVKRWRGKRARTAALSARVQAEHEAFMRGDSRGT